MKKACILLAVLCMALTATACSSGSNQDYYESAQLYLGSGEYEIAADLFGQLGEYADSADYALYCEAMQAIADEDYALARANLNAVAPFKSSERCLAWLDAVEAEISGDLEAALSLYAALGTFRDSDVKAADLRKAIPEAAIKEGRLLMTKGEYAAALEIFLSLEGYGASKALAETCTAAMNKAAYDAAAKLCKDGDHQAAMEAFLALGDVLDAPDRAEKCRASLLDGLDAQYQTVTLSTAAELATAYAAIDDESARTRALELSARFGKNLAVLADAANHPYVLLEDATLWQVQSAEGTMLTLRFIRVTEQKPTATLAPTASPAPTAEASAEPTADVTASPEPTALLPMTADLTPNGLTLKLDLMTFTFTEGEGTLEHPYR